MPNLSRVSRWPIWIGAAVLAVIGLTAVIVYHQLTHNRSTAAEQPEPPAKSKGVLVKVVHPRKGLLTRLSTQPGTIEAFQSVRLMAKVPGFLKVLDVDIGDQVKMGQVLAVVDVPELQAQEKRGSAAIDQAKSRVLQMKARVDSAVADQDAAQAAVKQAESTAKSATAWLKYRKIQLERMKALFATNSIEERIVDETKERFEAAVESELSANAAIITTKAQVVAARAKIEQAKADVTEADAEVKVAQAELEKTQAQLAYATITAPFDGVIAFRGFFPGDFVRAANEASNSKPVLTINRTDLMRVVVLVPDRDVPFVDVGDPAEVRIDALPGKKFHAVVSRKADSLDPETRLMRVELDLPNPSGKIVQGMYGNVTIVLDKGADLLSIDSACLVRKHDDGTGDFYVVRKGRAELVNVPLGTDSGLRVAVLNGLTTADEVILQPGPGLEDGAEVTIAPSNHAPEKKAHR